MFIITLDPTSSYLDNCSAMNYWIRFVVQCHEMGFIGRWCVDNLENPKRRADCLAKDSTHTREQEKERKIMNHHRIVDENLVTLWQVCVVCLVFFVLSIIKVPMKRRKIFVHSFLTLCGSCVARAKKKLFNVPKISIDLSLIVYRS